ncbi:uncharacterized protein K444DRAFT_407979 [Hyaloscypha bicolor E]|uniref:Uncharacterized protein n=1 Tax=Hyaloscypha bicolor E TaxID=1095630 RepID=A0A2J6T9M3_9HELO|nr:uncharacterized protein K444DRAFT_407979 [Hyaloscypha bicolor E]PMD59692.1 hypothetical protein K444DRAFT_407979 [Hyaloscypha bicolor E]
MLPPLRESPTSRQHPESTRLNNNRYRLFCFAFTYRQAACCSDQLQLFVLLCQWQWKKSRVPASSSPSYCHGNSFRRLKLAGNSFTHTNPRKPSPVLVMASFASPRPTRANKATVISSPLTAPASVFNNLSESLE